MQAFFESLFEYFLRFKSAENLEIWGLFGANT
jgi:hypothetical protein